MRKITAVISINMTLSRSCVMDPPHNYLSLFIANTELRCLLIFLAFLTHVYYNKDLCQATIEVD